MIVGKSNIFLKCGKMWERREGMGERRKEWVGVH